MKTVWSAAGCLAVLMLAVEAHGQQFRNPYSPYTATRPRPQRMAQPSTVSTFQSRPATPPPQLITPMQQQYLLQQQLAQQHLNNVLNTVQQQNYQLTPVQQQLILQYQQYLALQQQNAILSAMQQQQFNYLQAQMAMLQQQMQQAAAMAALQNRANQMK